MTDFDEAFERWQGSIRETVLSMRKAKGLTQRSLANAAGIKYGTYRPFESGHNHLTLPNLYRLASALDVTFGALLGDLQPGPTEAACAEEGGRVSLDPTDTHVQIAVDLEDIGLMAGDVLTLSRELDSVRAGAYVIVGEQDGQRVYRVRSTPPTILERDSGPAVVLDERYHQIEAVAIRLSRQL